MIDEYHNPNKQLPNNSNW